MKHTGISIKSHRLGKDGKLHKLIKGDASARIRARKSKRVSIKRKGTP